MCRLLQLLWLAGVAELSGLEVAELSGFAGMAAELSGFSEVADFRMGIR